MNKKIIAKVSILLILISVIILLLMGLNNNNAIVKNVELYFLQLEDADCNIIKHQDKVIIIDTGEKKNQEKIKGKLNQLKINNIDFLILTHPDKDHIGNAKYLIENYEVKNIIQTEYDKKSDLQNEMNNAIEEKGIKNLILKEHQQINLDELQLEIYPPKEQYEDSNNNSLIVLLKYKNNKVLYTGDIREERMQNIMDELEKVDILKYPYHGRKNEYSKQFIEKTMPKFTVITGTEPDKEIIEKLESINSKIRLTCEQNVEITLVEK